jgi:KTSC domain
MRLRGTLLFSLFVPGLVAAAPNQAIISRISRSQGESVALASIGYSKRQHALEIEFRNGAIYRYLDVPPQTYRDLLAASSKASYYDANVGHHFHSIHVKRAGGTSSASTHR